MKVWKVYNVLANYTSPVEIKNRASNEILFSKTLLLFIKGPFHKVIKIQIKEIIVLFFNRYEVSNNAL